MFGLVSKKKYEKLLEECSEVRLKFLKQLDESIHQQSFINDLLTTQERLSLLNNPLYNQPITLENTKGIRMLENKKGISYQAYLAIYVSPKVTRQIIIGSYPTIEKAYYARLEYINNLK